MSTSVTDTQHASRPGLPAGNLRMGDGRLLLLDRDASASMSMMVMDSRPLGPWRIWRTLEVDSFLVMGHMEETKKHGRILHVSMSYAKHYPSWSEIKDIKRVFFGAERDAMQVLARDSLWINIQPNCFHLYDCPDEWELL